MKRILIVLNKIKVWLYGHISDIKISCIKSQPLLVKGEGTVTVSKTTTFGVERSPRYYSSYSYIEARGEKSIVKIGNDCYFNNNASIISDNCVVDIGNDCLFGSDLQIINSDFHSLDPESRFSGGEVLRASVIIEDTVFVGNNVTILKGVTIGSGSVIGCGSVVTSSIGKNSIAAGSPAKVIRKI